MRLLKTRQVDFTQGSVMKAVLTFTIPVFFGNLFSSLYAIVDATVCGRFVGSAALAAVNASYSINMVLVALCAGLGVGTSVVISQYYGSRRMDQVSRAIGTALSSALAICLCLTVLGLLFSRPLLRLLGTPADILDSSVRYFRITLVGFAGQLLYGMSSGLLRGVGDSSFPALCVVFSSCLNIALDLLFVAVFRWGVAGVAWATVLSQYISAILPLRRLLSRRYGYVITRESFRIRLDYLKTILRIGLFSALNMMVTSFGLMLIQACANTFGTSFVAANGVVQKVDSFALLPMQALGGTVSTLCGQTLGAGQEARAMEGSRKSIALSCAIGALIGAAVFCCAPFLGRLFLTAADPDFAAVTRTLTSSLRILAFFYVAYALQQGLFCILQGAGALRPAMLMTALGMAVRVALTYLLAVRTGRSGYLFWATGLSYLLLAALYGACLKSGSFRRYVVVREKAQATGE